MAFLGGLGKTLGLNSEFGKGLVEGAAEGLAEGIEEGYKQKALIQTMDSRYEKKDIYRYCRPNC